MYDRRTEEIRAQHILLSVKPDAQGEDTLKAYNKALDLIRRAKAGESFDSLAIKYSEDKSAATNHGDIYYFTGGQMLKEFENAAYSMKVGEISSVPARTAFGYHVIKVLDRQPAHGTIKVRHIMARFLGAADSADTAIALKHVKGYQDSLKKGWDFEKLAAKVSEDAGTASKGGELGWFERRKLLQSLDEAAFRMKVGEISGIIRTQYGYHILKCDSIKFFPPYSDVRTDLKKVYDQYRYAEDYNAYLAGLKKNFNFSFDETAYRSFVALLDSFKTVGDSGWDEPVPQDVRKMPLISLRGRAISMDSVIGILKSKEDYNNLSLKASELRKGVDRFIEKLLLDEYSIGLEQRSPEFAVLMKDYQDGVVLYKAEQTEVWNKVTVTDSLLKKFYEENKSKFMFPERLEMSQIQLNSDTLAAMVYDSLTHGASFEALADRYNAEDADLKGKGGSRGLLPVTNDDLTEAASKLPIGEISEPIPMETIGFAIVRLNKKVPPSQKTFEEAGAEVSNTFQEYESKRMEQDWIDRIKKKYLVVEHKEVLRDAFSSPRASR
jgi:peptidyl-prolyl cis-trans isomerase SurA